MGPCENALLLDKTVSAKAWGGAWGIALKWFSYNQNMH